MKKNRYLIPIFILVLGLSFFVVKQAGKLQTKEAHSAEPNDFGARESRSFANPESLPKEKEETVVVGQKGNSEKPQIQKQSIEACVPFFDNNKFTNGPKDTLNLALKDLRGHYKIGNEPVDSIEYQLHAKDNAEIVVQYTPDEEEKEKVRVFKLGADGFPDRISEFPNAKASEKAKLKGALSLGTLAKKVEKYKVTNPDGTVLGYEKSNNDVTRIDFTNGRNQMICEDQLCQCHVY